MDRTERFYKITELLRQQRVVSFATLQAALEVSRSTLKRDLNNLCERLHNPIVYRRVWFPRASGDIRKARWSRAESGKSGVTVTLVTGETLAGRVAKDLARLRRKALQPTALSSPNPRRISVDCYHFSPYHRPDAIAPCEMDGAESQRS